MKPLSRRSVTTGLAAAVTAVPAWRSFGAAKPTPGKRIKLALDELRAALADRYPGVKFVATAYSDETGRIAFRTYLDGEPVILYPLVGNPHDGTEVVA
jgi:hypothetical protein